MVHPVTVDMRDIIVGAGLAEWGETDTNKWCLNIGSEPPEPGMCITLYDLDPVPNKSMNTDNVLEEAQFQARTKHPDYQEAYRMLTAVKNAFLEKTYWYVEEVHYKRIVKGLGPLYLRQDEKRRHRWVQTFTAFREYSEAATS